MANRQEALDGVFYALANETRREIVTHLTRGPASMTELAAPFDMALPSLLQHLQVLERNGLVSSVKVGRVRTYQLETPALLQAEHWMERRRAEWTSRLDQLDALFKTLRTEESEQ
jgi:DNA-binding transcriptional ArsR family regulator